LVKKLDTSACKYYLDKKGPVYPLADLTPTGEKRFVDHEENNNSYHLLANKIDKIVSKSIVP
jgi:hypothetical protein